MFGPKKVYCKVINGSLVVWVGGGYEVAEKFLKNMKDFQKWIWTPSKSPDRKLVSNKALFNKTQGFWK